MAYTKQRIRAHHNTWTTFIIKEVLTWCAAGDLHARTHARTLLCVEWAYFSMSRDTWRNKISFGTCVAKRSPCNRKMWLVQWFHLGRMPVLEKFEHYASEQDCFTASGIRTSWVAECSCGAACTWRGPYTTWSIKTSVSTDLRPIYLEFKWTNRQHWDTSTQCAINLTGQFTRVQASAFWVQVPYNDAHPWRSMRLDVWTEVRTNSNHMTHTIFGTQRNRI